MSDIHINGQRWEPITEGDREAYAEEIERASVEITISCRRKSEPVWVPFDPPLVIGDQTIKGVWSEEWEVAP